MLLLLLALLVPATASAEDLRTSRHLWATVNACDTPRNPDAIGVRASMPGSGRRGQTLWMRFRVQRRDRAQGTWVDLDGLDSGFVRVGDARYKARQSGWMFPFALAAGQRFRLRGVVDFQWRSGTRIVLQTSEPTTSGHRAAVADPRGYSAASCVVRG